VYILFKDFLTKGLIVFAFITNLYEKGCFCEDCEEGSDEGDYEFQI